MRVNSEAEARLKIPPSAKRVVPEMAYVKTTAANRNQPEESKYTRYFRVAAKASLSS
jgi:hypothetical protein